MAKYGPPKIRPEVSEAVRRAVGLTYIHAAEPFSIATLTAALDEPALTAEVLADWAEQDDWESSRAEVRGVDAVRREAEERRRQACIASVEQLHNDAQRLQAGLRPKSWEGAANLQLRCAEALRDWTLLQPLAEEAVEKTAEPDDDIRSDLSDGEWQHLSHVALSMRDKGEEVSPDGVSQPVDGV